MIGLHRFFLILVLMLSFKSESFGQANEERHIGNYSPSGNGYHITFEYRTAFSIGLGMAHVLAEGPTSTINAKYYTFEGNSYYPSQLDRSAFYFNKELRFDMEFDVQYYTGIEYVQVCHKVITNVGKDVSFSHLGGSSAEFTSSLTAGQKDKLNKDENEINSYFIRNIKISNISSRDHALESEIQKRSLIEQGNKAFSTKDYSKALELYKSASNSSNSAALKNKIRITEKKIQEIATEAALKEFEKLKPIDLSKAVNVLKNHLKTYPNDSKVKNRLAIEEFEYLDKKPKKEAEKNAKKAEFDRKVANAKAEAKTKDQNSKKENKNNSEVGSTTGHQGSGNTNSGYQADQSIYSKGTSSSAATYGEVLLPLATTSGSASVGSALSYAMRNAGKWGSMLGGYSAWGAASYFWLKPALMDDAEVELDLGFESVILQHSGGKYDGNFQKYRTVFNMGPMIGAIPYGGGAGWDLDLMTSVVKTDYLSVETGFDGAYFLGTQMQTLTSQYQWKTRFDIGHYYFRPFVTYSRGVNYVSYNQWNEAGNDRFNKKYNLSKYEIGFSLMTFMNISVYGYHGFGKIFKDNYNSYGSGGQGGFKIEIEAAPYYKLWFARYTGLPEFNPNRQKEKENNILLFEIGFTRPITVFY